MKLRSVRALLGVALAILLTPAGCGDDDDPSPQAPATTPAETDDAGQAPDEMDDADQAPAGRTDASQSEPGEVRLVAPPCPTGSANCARASGRIIYVEKVDPDGDGDAHFVLTSPESITAPGLSVIDVRADLRPSPLPEPGDRLAASGPVYRGSYGQRQIQADAIRVAKG